MRGVGGLGGHEMMVKSDESSVGGGVIGSGSMRTSSSAGGWSVTGVSGLGVGGGFGLS